MSNGLISRIKNWVAGDPFEDDIYQLEEEFDYPRGQYDRPTVPYEAETEMPVEIKRKKNLKK